MTPAEAELIRQKCRGLCGAIIGKHPLGGLSVAEWVAEARAGWPGTPKAPTPRQAAERGQRITAKHDGVVFAQLALT